MSESVTFELTAEARELVQEMKEWPAPSGEGSVLQKLAKEMDRQNQLTLAVIIKQHLTGQGPFAPEEHRLGVKTGRLRGAAWASPAQVTGEGRIESAIG